MNDNGLAVGIRRCQTMCEPWLVWLKYFIKIIYMYIYNQFIVTTGSINVQFKR